MSDAGGTLRRALAGVAFVAAIPAAGIVTAFLLWYPAVHLRLLYSIAIGGVVCVYIIRSLRVRSRAHNR